MLLLAMPNHLPHLFWFFGHPEVGMAYAMVAIVWRCRFCRLGVNHRQSVDDIKMYFTAATMVIEVPTGITIFSGIATMWGGSVTFKTPMVWALGSVSSSRSLTVSIAGSPKCRVVT
jgi:cytochrome c oxidase subunit I